MGLEQRCLAVRSGRFACLRWWSLASSSCLCCCSNQCRLSCLQMLPCQLPTHLMTTPTDCYDGKFWMRSLWIFYPILQCQMPHERFSWRALPRLCCSDHWTQSLRLDRLVHQRHLTWACLIALSDLTCESVFNCGSWSDSVAIESLAAMSSAWHFQRYFLQVGLKAWSARQLGWASAYRSRSIDASPNRNRSSSLCSSHYSCLPAFDHNWTN